MSIERLRGLDEELTNQAVTVFVDGFYDVFAGKVTKDKNILHELFKDSFNTDMVYVSLVDNQIAGFLGLGNYQKRALKLKKETCQRLFGKRYGVVLYKQMGAMLEKITVRNDNEGYIDYITTAPQYRGKGIATQLIWYICENLPYTIYTLDVKAKNTNAVKLYEKLGFVRTKEKMNLITLLAGLGKLLTMQLKLKTQA